MNQSKEPHENNARRIIDEVDPDWKGLICISGILLILVPIVSIVLLYYARILYSSGYPIDPAAYLRLIAQHQKLAALIWSGWIFIDILPLPAILAMYIVLRCHNKTLALFGSLIAIFYAIYDVSATEINSLTLVSLANGYADATTEALKASFIGAATYGYHALAIQTVLSFALGPLAYILWCVPMAKSFFGRLPAIIGIVVSVIGLAGTAFSMIPSSYILGLCMFLGPRLEALWSILVGVLLYRYGRRLPTIVDMAEATS